MKSNPCVALDASGARERHPSFQRLPWHALCVACLVVVGLLTHAPRALAAEAGGPQIENLSSEAIGTLPGYWTDQGDLQALLALGPQAWLAYGSLSTTVFVPAACYKQVIDAAVGEGFVLLNHVKNKTQVRMRFFGDVRVAFKREVLEVQNLPLGTTVGALYSGAEAWFALGARDPMPLTLPSTGQFLPLWSLGLSSRNQGFGGPPPVGLYATTSFKASSALALVTTSEHVWAMQTLH